MLHIEYGHYHIQSSHGCLATRQLWENGLVVKSILYCCKATRITFDAFFKDNVLKYRIYLIILG